MTDLVREVNYQTPKQNKNSNHWEQKYCVATKKKKKILTRFPVFSKNCGMCVNILREKKQSTETVSMCPQMLVSADTSKKLL